MANPTIIGTVWSNPTPNIGEHVTLTATVSDPDTYPVGKNVQFQLRAVDESGAEAVLDLPPLFFKSGDRPDVVTLTLTSTDVNAVIVKTGATTFDVVVTA